MLRFWLALTTFVVGLTLTAIGLVNQLENQPLRMIIAEAELTTPTTYVMIPNKVLTAYPGKVSVTANNDGQVFLAAGRESDIVGWIGKAQYAETRLGVNQAKEEVLISEVERGGGGELADPRGSDLWRLEVAENFEGKISVPEGNEVGVLIAAKGIDMAPRKIKIEWDLPDEGVPVAPITMVGLGLMLAGALWSLWLFITGYRKSGITRNWNGPRRPKLQLELPKFKKKDPEADAPVSPRRQARGLKFVALALVAASLSGCTPEYQNPVLSPSPSPAQDTLTPVMTKDQLKRVLGEITAVVAEADAELDREIIEVRVTGPALVARRAAYNIARRTEDPQPPAPLLAAPIQLFLPSATDTWPRSVMVVTGEQTLTMMILRQESARDQYRLYQYMDILPGVDFPAVAAEEVGANTVKEDSKFLLMPPADLAKAVGSLLNEGPDSAWSILVDGDNQYIKDVSSVQQSLAETLSNANVTFDHKISNDEMVLLTSGEGGALVGVYMIDTYTIIPKSPGDAVAISGQEAILLGAGGSATGIETRYGAMLLFHMPAAGSESRARLLGATQQLLTAISLGAR
ncbi:MAG: hypothetical protein RLZZ72_388 [Actinomycetota bacterium]